MSNDTQYDVTYEINSGMDAQRPPVTTATIIVTADSAKSARLKARDWVWDNDPYCDDRIDPRVRIRSARRR